jgi:hypothetical protein
MMSFGLILAQHIHLENNILRGMSPQRIDSLKSTSQVNSDVTNCSGLGHRDGSHLNPGEVIEANKEFDARYGPFQCVGCRLGYEKDLATIHVGSGGRKDNASRSQRRCSEHQQPAVCFHRD